MGFHYQIRPVSRKAVDSMVCRHYLHRWPGVVVCSLGLFDEESAIGVIVFALPPRETCKRYGVSVAWELARLFIEDAAPKNTETWFVAKSIAYLRRNFPQVELLVSYADPSAGHEGIIYKAGNWISDGRTDQERKTPRFDYSVDGKIYSRRAHVPDGATIVRVPRISKWRFIYWMRDHEKKRQAKKGTICPSPTPNASTGF